MKKISIIILLLSVFLITGCDKSNKVVVNGKKINTSKMEHKHCTRTGSLDDGDVELNYDLYYTGDKLNVLKSEEKVISSKEDVLNTYEDAYKSIHKNYEGLKYYDTKVERDNTSVTSTITIDYDKVNINKLISIEGEEDNIFENKVPKVDKWITLAKKFGTKCKTIED